MDSTKKQHWDRVYETKNPDQVSWTQDIPRTSLNFIRSFNLPKSAKIIDIGGGDSKLADYLIDEGFGNITVLDISEKALSKAKHRLGDKAKLINWVVGDITEIKPAAHFDLWHDRAAFHFLTTAEQIEKYLDAARNSVSGYLIVGTFSDTGPSKCSGLDIKQYSEQTLTKAFETGFEKLDCIREDHVTPFQTKQNFLFCSFKRRLNSIIIPKKWTIQKVRKPG